MEQRAPTKNNLNSQFENMMLNKQLSGSSSFDTSFAANIHDLDWNTMSGKFKQDFKNF